MNTILIRILAKALLLLLVGPDGKHHKAICIWFHNLFVLVVNQSVTLLDQDFPRDSMEERMVDGPITKFAKTIAPKIIVNLDNTVTAQFQSFLEVLDKVGVE